MSGYDDEDYASSLNMNVWKRLFGIAKRYKGKFAIVGGVAFVVGAVDASWAFMTGWIVDHAILPGSTDAILAFIPFYLTVSSSYRPSPSRSSLMSRPYRHGHLLRHSLPRLREAQGALFLLLRQNQRRVDHLASYERHRQVERRDGLGHPRYVLGRDDDAGHGGRTHLDQSDSRPRDPLCFAALLFAAAWFRKRILTASREAQGKAFTAAFGESIKRARTIKSLAVEGLFKHEFAAKARRLKELCMHGSVPGRSSCRSWYSSPMLARRSRSGQAGHGARRALSVGSLVAFVFTAIQFFEPVSELRGSSRSSSKPRHRPSAFSRCSGRSPRSRTPWMSGSPRDVTGTEAQARLPLRGCALRGVSFSYGSGGERSSLISTSDHRGFECWPWWARRAVPSSLANLMCRFYEPSSGRILVDGIDYRKWSQSWLHAHLGYVLQSPSLFSGSVRENIRYGRLSASDEEVEKAARAVGAHEFISQLEGGYDADVGLGGSLLSTGQKQLVSFARALIADPRILVLDEATSSVDSETERLIQEAVGKVLAGRTSLVIAHRLSTVARADRIIVLDKGRIVEDGSHGELLALGGRYRALYEGQFLSEGEMAALEA